MDSKDFQLLAAQHMNARQSYQSLGRLVSLSAPTVRERLKRLQRDGVIRGYGLWVEPGIFGHEEVLVFFGHERRLWEVNEALEARDVAWIGWKLDGGLTVGAWTRDVGRCIQDLTSALGEVPSGYAIAARHEVPMPSSLDWQIIEALVDNPRLPLKDLIVVTRLSPKTVRKRLQSLFESQTVVVVPRQGASSGSGELVYNLAVAGEAPMSELRDVIGDTILIHMTHKPPMKYLLCRGDDLADVTAKVNTLNKLTSVRSAGVSLNRDLLFATDFLHGLLRKQIDA